MSAGVIDKTVFGNKRVMVISFSAGGAEENITTGLDYVDHFSCGVQSVATSAFTMKTNQDSSGTASNGSIGVSGVASGDQMYIYAYGR